MFCVLRVSIQTCTPSLSSIRESRHHGGCCLPCTVTLSAMPASLQPRRTSANDFFPANSAKHGNRCCSSSLIPAADHFSSVRRHGAEKRKSIVGEISASICQLSIVIRRLSFPIQRSQMLAQELVEIAAVQMLLFDEVQSHDVVIWPRVVEVAIGA